MQLTQTQIEQFDRDGYLFFPSLFTPEEMPRPDRRGAPSLCPTSARERAREGQRRGAHQLRRAHVQRAIRQARPPSAHGRHRCMQIFGEPVYMHQFKINGKMAFDGDVWQWHQDYGTWKNDDLMPEARAMNVAIFLDEVNEFNGPLMFIPGSHKLGVLDAEHDVTTTSYPLWTIDHDTIRKLVERGGLVARPKGPPGSMIMFHCVPGARLDGQSVALEPGQRLPEPLRGVEPHPPLQATRVHRPPGLHADRVPARRLPAAGLRRAAALAGRHTRGGVATCACQLGRRYPMNLYAKLCSVRRRAGHSA